MPALVAGIHAFSSEQKGVDGRDKPGHDETGRRAYTRRVTSSTIDLRYPKTHAQP